MLQPTPDPSPRNHDPTHDLIRNVLAELLIQLEIPQENSRVLQAVRDATLDADETTMEGLSILMMRAGTAVGLRVAPLELSSGDVWQLLMDGFPVAIVDQLNSDQRQAYVFSNISGGRCETTKLLPGSKESDALTQRQVRQCIDAAKSPVFFVAEPSLACDKVTSASETSQHDLSRVSGHGHNGHDHGHGDGHGHDHEHLPPLRRWLRLLKLDARDIWTISIFTVIVSVLELATPLAVEQMVTTIGFASVVQPLIWIAILLFAILTLSGVIKALQLFVVEILQRRMMVRVVGDLAARLPRLDRSAMDGIHGPEMANRFFDVMTMQKATASLLIDVLALTIQTITGLLLLAVYSPYLLAFDIILLLCMTILIMLLGRGAVRTAIEESLIKYRIAHWLEDVIGNPNAFQVHGGSELSIDRSNRMVVEYLAARRKHFLVLIRQSLFALMLYAVSISALLSLGGWLVLSESLSIGQLVASVSVVAVVVGAFSKIGKSLETYYDLMAATDKVGHLIDLPTIPPARALDAGIGPVDVRFKDLSVGDSHHPVSIPSHTIAAGERVALVGEGRCGKTALLQVLAGIRFPNSGLAEVAGIDSRDVNRFEDGSMVGFAADLEVFHGSLLENVTLNRISIPTDDVREALQTCDLWDEVLALPKGLETSLQSGGYPLSHTQGARLMLARAIVAKPRLLLIDGTLDRLPQAMRMRTWEALSNAAQPWTLLLVTNDPELQAACSQTIHLHPHDGHAHHG
ncbi:MAG: ATP-binding cassette domain-containing protein [Pirellula sp.]